MENNDWTVWGDGREPLLEGTEADCKHHIEDLAMKGKDDGIYLAGPDGNEWVYNASMNKWVTE